MQFTGPLFGGLFYRFKFFRHNVFPLASSPPHLLKYHYEGFSDYYFISLRGG